jgi:hypothetical protein
MRNKNRIISIYQPDNYGTIMKIVEPDMLSVLVYRHGGPTNYRVRLRLKNIQFLPEMMPNINHDLVGKFCTFENSRFDSFGITSADVFIDSNNLVEILKSKLYAM